MCWFFGNCVGVLVICWCFDNCAGVLVMCGCLVIVWVFW